VLISALAGEEGHEVSEVGDGEARRGICGHEGPFLLELVLDLRARETAYSMALAMEAFMSAMSLEISPWMLEASPRNEAMAAALRLCFR
jgi:hypothetical protein